MIPHIVEPVRRSLKRALDFDGPHMFGQSTITSSGTSFDYACSSDNLASLQSLHNHMKHRLFSACDMSADHTCGIECEWTSDACPCLEYPCSCDHLRGPATAPLYFRLIARPTGGTWSTTLEFQFPHHPLLNSFQAKGLADVAYL